MRRPAAFTLALAAALGLTLVFLGLPLVALLVNTSPSKLVASLGDAAALDALRLSLETSAIALAVIVVVGTPAAWLLATREFRFKAALVTLLELPLVLPPAAAGIALLAALGPHGIAGGLLADAHVTLVLTTAGVVVAMTFVASPFYLRQAQSSFAALDPRLLEASRTLGAGEARTLARVAIPLARPGLAAGAALAWARALGEFGATLMFAGNLSGRTQTLPLAVYTALESDLRAAQAIALVMVAMAFVLLLVLRRGAAASGGPALGFPPGRPEERTR